MMTDYYRNEASQAMVGYACNKMLKTQGPDNDDLTVYDQNGGADDPNFFSNPLRSSYRMTVGSQSNFNASGGNQRVISRASRDVDYFGQQHRPQFS